jgi:hypothetical protein
LAFGLAPAEISTLILLDSRSLYQIISSFKQSGMDARIAAVVDRLRDSIITAELSDLGWVPRYAQLVDMLTKRNPTGNRSLMAASESAAIDIPECGDFRYNSWLHIVSGDEK